MDQNQFLESAMINLKGQCHAYTLAFADSPKAKMAFQQIESQLDDLLNLVSKNQNQTEVKLTKKEVEVLSYAGQGFTNREISMALNVSEKTIEFHLTSIYRKLSAANRSEAIATALREKIIK